MATFYLDFENGNDANDGTTFANRWKTLTSGAYAGRIGPGDTIRIMGSPAPTSLGINGTWTSQALQATKSVTGATNATPISITCTAHGYSTGDTVVMTGDSGNTAANGTWEITVVDANTFTLNGSVGSGTSSGTRTARLRNNTRIKLASALTANIASTGPNRAAWTAVAGGNVTTSLNTTTKEHYQSDSIAIGAGFTTGLAAYWATGTLDLSGYQQVSFWIHQTTGTVGAAGAVDLRLCSDTAGATAVNTISIPNLAGAGFWMPVTVNLGTNLGNSINSIAFYVNTDNGAQTFLLSNIIACKASSAADSLSLTSFIGKNTTGETWWGIQSINGTRVMLDSGPSTTPTFGSVRGYYGATETVTTWKREVINLSPSASFFVTKQAIQASGTEGSQITFSGGWDRVNMTSKDLETWLSGQNGTGYGIDISRNYITMENLAIVRCYKPAFSATYIGFGLSVDFKAGNNNETGYTITIKSGTWKIDHAAANTQNGVYTGDNNDCKITLLNVVSNGSQGVSTTLFPNTILTATSQNNGANGFYADAFSSGGLMVDCVSRDNAVAGVSNIRNFILTAKNCVFNETSDISLGSAYDGSFFYSHNHNQVADNHKIFVVGGLISAATDFRHTASGFSWKMQPTSTSVRTSGKPLILPLAKIACAANSLVTVKAWMRRSNTGLTMRLVCKGGQIAGVTSDTVSAMTAAADTWEELTITFTPTEVGVVEITAEAWGGTTYSGWVDDLTITQV